MATPKTTTLALDAAKARTRFIEFLPEVGSIVRTHHEMVLLAWAEVDRARATAQAMEKALRERVGVHWVASEIETAKVLARRGY